MLDHREVGWLDPLQTKHSIAADAYSYLNSIPVIYERSLAGMNMEALSLKLSIAPSSHP
jgi:hypothetical protein